MTLKCCICTVHWADGADKLCITCRDNLAKYIPEPLKRPIRFDAIVAVVCGALGVLVSDLGAPSRHPKVVLAREMVTHLGRQHTTLSYPEIARAIGRPNHSTVITSHQRLKWKLEAKVGHECRSVYWGDKRMDLGQALQRASDTLNGKPPAQEAA